ncbi:MAG TPA: CPXCG motif-containing cysteine-rich protein [Gammaproteobacteria bacterium]
MDCSVEYQRYIEDCQVCCRPMTITVSIGDNGQASVEVSHEDET